MFSHCSGMSSRPGCRSAPTRSPWGNSVGKWPDQTCHQPAEQVTPPFHPGVHKSAVKLLQNKADQNRFSHLTAASIYIEQSILNCLCFSSATAGLPPIPQPSCSSTVHPPPISLQSACTRHKLNQDVPAKSRPTSAHHPAPACRAPHDRNSAFQGRPSDSFQGRIFHLRYCIQRSNGCHPCLRNGTVIFIMKLNSANL